MVSTVELERIQQRITAFDFKTLFIEELGWNRHSRQFLIEVRGVSYTLTALAEKKDRLILLCESDAIPQHPVRVAIEHEIARLTHTHLIIFVDTRHRQQLWLYAPRIQHDGVSRQRYYSLPFYTGHSGLPIAQKISTLAIDISEEERLTGTQIDERLSALQVERVTKRFYDLFRAEHTALSAAIEGLPTADLRESYALALLNRLMFTYFIQKKSFLNGDPDYLRTKLAEMRNQGGFFTFYKTFLLTFFHDGLGKKRDARSDTVQHLLGSVPYLNGGLFEPHAIELEHAASLDVPDAAFTRIFAFFDRYDWHLDTREMRNDNEINPDVLGYIFEKYINQKQMGAYYTKEDITEYISKNTIIPFIFDRLSQREIAAAKPDGSIWNLLREDPDRYLYDAVRHGVDEPLPNEIAAGIERVAERGQWNQSAPPPFALPTETWREHIARRQRCHDVRAKLRTGEITSINDLITYNLNIIQFALDAIQQSPDAQFLAAIHAELATITILDPTCGSGAFLFAALNILEPLYEASLDRMQIVVDEVDAAFYQEQQHYIQQFRTILKESDQHPNRTYAIDKGIIMRNLYGVDIMPEAVEIAKLRLFLTLVAHVDSADRIEPLPDIDFNIRAGNTLVGFAAETDVVRAIGLDMEQRLPVIRERAREVGRVYDIFRDLQTRIDVPPDAIRAAKDDVQRRLNDLRAELDRYLASEYGIDRLHIADEHHYAEKLAQWKASHQPFHWYAEFFDIMNDGGFDVIIGNPPYLEIKEINYKPKNYVSFETSAVHALMIERGLNLMQKQATISMIVPLSLVSTQRMAIVQKIIEANNRSVWYSNFSWRPGKLFETVNRALTIFVSTPNNISQIQSTNYQKWVSDSREDLIREINLYQINDEIRSKFWIPKININLEYMILKKMLSVQGLLGQYVRKKTLNRIFYRTDGGLYWKVFTDFPPRFVLNGIEGHSSRETNICLSENFMVKPTIALLSSNLFWWWYSVTSNCRHLNPYDIYNVPVQPGLFEDFHLSELGSFYLEDIIRNSNMLLREQKQTGIAETQSFKISKSKPIIDEIDRVLAQHYGFTEEELDFIINYDIKYRMGRDAEESGEE